MKERKSRNEAIQNGISIIDSVINDNWDLALNKLHSK
jgi:hypothetical protein